MVQPGCAFLNSKSRPPHPRNKIKTYEDDASSIKSFVKASLLKPPKQLPPVDTDGYSVESFSKSDADMFDEYTPTSTLVPRPSPSGESVNQGESVLSAVLGLSPEQTPPRAVDPSLQHLKSSIACLLEELGSIDQQLHPRKVSKLAILHAEVKRIPDFRDKVAEQVDTLNFMMSWLATEKRTLDWHLALLGEKVRNLEREVRELEGKHILHGSRTQSDCDIAEELWAEFLSASKEQQQVHARVTVERKIRRRVEIYVKRFLKHSKIPPGSDPDVGTKNHATVAKDPTAFFAETNSLDWNDSIHSDVKSFTSVQSNSLSASLTVSHTRIPSTDDNQSSFEIFGSDFVPLGFNDMLDGVRGGASPKDGGPVKCFSFNAPSFKRWSSLNAALARLGSKEEGIGFWLRKSKDLPHDELSDDDSDFEEKFASSVVSKSVTKNGAVRVKATNPGKVNRNADWCSDESNKFVPETELNPPAPRNLVTESPRPQGIGRNRSMESRELSKLTDDFRHASIHQSQSVSRQSTISSSGLESRRTRSADLGHQMEPKPALLHRYAKSLGPEVRSEFRDSSNQSTPSNLSSSSPEVVKRIGVGKVPLLGVPESSPATERIDLFEWNRRQSWYNTLYQEGNEGQ